MSAGQLTEAEATAMAKLGYVPTHAAQIPSGVLAAYRAGVRDGAEQPGPRVFYAGDPAPAERIALLDESGTVEWWAPEDPDWPRYVADYGPLVEVPGCPDFEAALKEQRRRGDAR